MSESHLQALQDLLSESDDEKRDIPALGSSVGPLPSESLRRFRHSISHGSGSLSPSLLSHHSSSHDAVDGVKKGTLEKTIRLRSPSPPLISSFPNANEKKEWALRQLRRGLTGHDSIQARNSSMFSHEIHQDTSNTSNNLAANLSDHPSRFLLNPPHSIPDHLLESTTHALNESWVISPPPSPSSVLASPSHLSTIPIDASFSGPSPRSIPTRASPHTSSRIVSFSPDAVDVLSDHRNRNAVFCEDSVARTVPISSSQTSFSSVQSNCSLDEEVVPDAGENESSLSCSDDSDSESSEQAAEEQVQVDRSQLETTLHPYAKSTLSRSEKLRILETECKAGGSNLSGGFAQSVALARIFLRPNARLLILDESMSAMDPFKKREIIFPHLLNFVRSRNMTLLFITHDMVSCLLFLSLIFPLGIQFYSLRNIDFSPIVLEFVLYNRQVSDMSMKF